jgi:Ca2+-binding RTX toxin-like protein
VDAGGRFDQLQGGNGHDLLNAGAGEGDSLYGGEGNDTLHGGAGNGDWLEPGTGLDSLNGGPGRSDVAVYVRADGPVVVSLQAATATGSGTDSLTGLEDIFGSRFNDTLTGHAGPTRIVGVNGSDTITGTRRGRHHFCRRWERRSHRGIRQRLTLR